MSSIWVGLPSWEHMVSRISAGTLPADSYYAEYLVVKSSGRQTMLAPPLVALSIIATPFSRLSS